MSKEVDRLLSEQAEARTALDAAVAEYKAEPSDKGWSMLESLESEHGAFAAKLADAEAKAATLDKIERMADAKPIKPATAVEARTLGEAFVNSPEFKAALAHRSSYGGKVDISAHLETKATITEIASAIQPVHSLPGIQAMLQRPLRVADLFPSGTTGANSVRTVEETTFTNAAVEIVEAGAKPAATLIFTPVDEVVRKIAVSIKVSDEMLEDVAGMQSYVDGRLRLMVQLREDSQLLLGNGTSPNLSGIQDRTITATSTHAGGAVYANEVRAYMATLEAASQLRPDALVVNPADWETLRTEMDASDRHYGGGPFDPSPDSTYWGMRVVVTAAQTAGLALLGNFSQGAQIFRRTGLTVEASNSNEADFLANLIAIRAEERLALCVYRPLCFGVYDFVA